MRLGVALGRVEDAMSQLRDAYEQTANNRLVEIERDEPAVVPLTDRLYEPFAELSSASKHLPAHLIKGLPFRRRVEFAVIDEDRL